MSEQESRLAGVGIRRIVFTVLVLVPLAVYVLLFQMWRNQALLLTSWVGGMGLLPEIFYHPAHRLHEFAAALMMWPLLIGLLAQFRAPRKHVTGMVMALYAMVAVLLAIAITGGWEVAPILAFLGVPTLLATVAHPAGRELVTSFSGSNVNRVTLVLVVIAAIPLLAFAANQVALQTGAIEPGHEHGAGAGNAEEIHEQHVEHHHFMFVVAFVLGVIGVGLLASFQLPGWWLGAWVAGLMMAVYSIAGLLAPEASSNPGLLWNLAGIAWAVVFVAAAERTQDTATPSLLGARRSTTTADR